MYLNGRIKPKTVFLLQLNFLNESLRLAKLHLAQGNLSQGLAICQEIIASQPNHPEAYAVLGQIQEAEGNLGEAMEAYAKAIEIKPDFAEARAYLGQLYSEVNWWEEAAYQYRQAIQLGIQWPQLYGNLGHVLQKIGDLEAAKNCYEKAVFLSKSYYANAHFNIALVLHQQGKLAAAVETYQQLIEKQPDYINAYNNLGCVFAQIGNLDEAIKVYQQGLKLKPDWARLHNNLGEALGLKEQPVEAIAAYNRAIELEPDLASAHYKLGKTLQSIGEHKLAVCYFEKVTNLEPNNILAWSDRGFSLMAIGKLKEAIASWRKAVINSDFVDGYCQWVETRLTAYLEKITDELDLAKIACAKFLRLLQTSEIISTEAIRYLWEICWRFGNVLMESGAYETAQVYYEKALQIQPNHPDVCLRLGNSLVKQQRFNAAIVAYRMALATLPKTNSENLNPIIYYHLGKLLEKQQKWEQALEFYEQVWHSKPLKLPQQQLYQISHNSTFPTTATAGCPQGLYLSSQDWIEANNLAGDCYLAVTPKQSEQIQSNLQSSIAKLNPIDEESELSDLGEKIQVGQTPIVSKPGCDGLNCSKCLKRIYWWFEPIYRAGGVYSLTSQKLEASSGLPTFVVKVPEGRAWIMPKKSYWMLCHAIAIITPDNYLLADISRDYPGQLPGCDKYDPTQHLAFSLEEFPPLERIDGKVAILSSLSGNVYFHWMVDLLPRIEILRRAGITWDEIDWFVVNSNQSAFQKKTLDALGIPPEKILSSDRHPHIQAKELVVPSFGSHLGWLQPWGLEFLREVFLTEKAISKKTGFPKRIYISRERAKYRRVLNEPEVIELLSQYGVVPVSPESMSLEDQIAMFADAQTIVAPHGSGLTNIIFCSPGTKIIEIVSPHYLRYYYWTVSQQLGLEHYYLSGDAFSCYPLRQLMYSSPLAEDIMVNLGSLKKAMSLVLDLES